MLYNMAGGAGRSGEGSLGAAQCEEGGRGITKDLPRTQNLATIICDSLFNLAPAMIEPNKAPLSGAAA